MPMVAEDTILPVMAMLEAVVVRPDHANSIRRFARIAVAQRKCHFNRAPTNRCIAAIVSSRCAVSNNNAIRIIKSARCRHVANATEEFRSRFSLSGTPVRPDPEHRMIMDTPLPIRSDYTFSK